MSPRLPTLTGHEVIAVFQRHGCAIVRQSGSHVILRHTDGRRTTVLVHAARDLGRGLLRQVMRDANLTADDLTR